MGDDGDVETPQNRLLGLAIKQELERRLDATFRRVSACRQSLASVSRHRHMVASLAACDTHDDLEFERVAFAGSLDLDHPAPFDTCGLVLANSIYPRVEPWLARSNAMRSVTGMAPALRCDIRAQTKTRSTTLSLRYEFRYALSSVMPAHSALEDARKRAYVAGIHLFRAPERSSANRANCASRARRADASLAPATAIQAEGPIA